MFIKLFIFYCSLNLVSADFLDIKSTSTKETPSIIEIIESKVENRDSFLEWIQSILAPTTEKEPTIEIPSKPPRDCAACNCGKANTLTRIVGGYETEVNQYPWMTMLLSRNRFYCGGSLISDQYILTAAHCLRGFRAASMSIRLMAHNRTTKTTEVIQRKVEYILPHEKYDPNRVNNDIGLIKLKEPVEFSDVLRPVCLPDRDETYDGWTGIATGWGAIAENGPLAENLREVHVPIMSLEECRKSGYGNKAITENMLCAGQVKDGGVDACQGDSGGPLHVHRNDTEIYQLPGIVSWGIGCARPKYPGIYTRVSQYIDWIMENTRDSCGCTMATPESEIVEK